MVGPLRAGDDSIDENASVKIAPTCATCMHRGASAADGGLERPLKDVRSRLGHASIKMTLDVYGYLFLKADATAEMEAAERALLGTTGCQHAGELTRYFNGV
jgi:hypothetical protein